MLRIGIDVGSTYTKYCVINRDEKIEKVYVEKTPIHQKEYFEEKIIGLQKLYDDELSVVSCGYGKKNVNGIRRINELTALAKGAEYYYPGEQTVLDIGGQDTKVIRQEKGKLKDFFVNDICAAGSGMFLVNVVNMLAMSFDDIVLVPFDEMEIKLSSTCAVFAESQIVELIAENIDENMILSAVVFQILTQAKKLLAKVQCEKLVLSGGLTNIKGFKKYAESVLGVECLVGINNRYLSAIGCALMA